MTNIRNTPIEAIERAINVRVRAYPLRSGSGGAGAGPGGNEARATRLRGHCTVRLDPGDVLRMLTPGGGVWGMPPAT